MEEEGRSCSQPTCFPDRSELWVPRKLLLELGIGIKQRVGGGIWEGEICGISWREGQGWGGEVAAGVL